MSVALALFDDLCAVGNALGAYRDTHAPCSDDWATLTCLILHLDAAIDRLVRSEGLACDEREDA
jgi:hypothetical protein